MNAREMNVLLTKAALLDPRMKRVADSERLDMIDAWAEILEDLPLEAGLAALRRFFRERPDGDLRPGHLLELAGIADELPAVPDIQGELEAEWREREAAGETFVDVEPEPQWAKPYQAGDLE